MSEIGKVADAYLAFLFFLLALFWGFILISWMV